MNSSVDRVELVARALAKADGKDPDAPAWVEGYGNREKTFGICWRDQYSEKAKAAIEALTSGDSVLGLREALKDARAGFEAVQDIFTAIRGRGSISVETQIERIDKALATQPVDTNEAPLLDEVERVARALVAARGGNPDECISGYSWAAGEMGNAEAGSVCHRRMWQERIVEARAALEAIRNPSVEGMK